MAPVEKHIPCGKVLHTSMDSAGIQAESLLHRYRRRPNVYQCMICTHYYSVNIWHVGYGYDAPKMQKSARRRRSQSRKKKR